MIYQIYIQRRAQKVLANIAQTYQDKIVSVIRSLSETPRPHGSKKLTGRNAWRIRIGEYRVIYEINDQNLSVNINDIGHRGKIYKNL